jgi:hypothetical protein
MSMCIWKRLACLCHKIKEKKKSSPTGMCVSQVTPVPLLQPRLRDVTSGVASGVVQEVREGMTNVIVLDLTSPPRSTPPPPNENTEHASIIPHTG